MWRACGRFQRFDVARDRTAGHASSQQFRHQAETPTFIAAHRDQRSCKRCFGISGWRTIGINRPAFGNTFACRFGHGDFTQRHRRGRLVKLHRNASLPVGHGKGDRVGADHPAFAAGWCHNWRGIGQAQSDQPRLRNLSSEIPQRGAGVSMTNRQRRGATCTRGGNRFGQSTRKGRLGKSEPCINLDHPRFRAGDNRGDAPIHATRGQLLAIAFQIVQAANPIAHSFGLAHGICHRVGNPVVGAMAA